MVPKNLSQNEAVQLFERENHISKLQIYYDRENLYPWEISLENYLNIQHYRIRKTNRKGRKRRHK